MAMSGHTPWGKLKHKGKCNAPIQLPLNDSAPCVLPVGHSGPHKYEGQQYMQVETHYQPCRVMVYGFWKLDYGRPGHAACMKPKGHEGKHDADWEPQPDFAEIARKNEEDIKRAGVGTSGPDVTKQMERCGEKSPVNGVPCDHWMDHDGPHQNRNANITWGHYKLRTRAGETVPAQAEVRRYLGSEPTTKEDQQKDTYVPAHTLAEPSVLPYHKDGCPSDPDGRYGCRCEPEEEAWTPTYEKVEGGLHIGPSVVVVNDQKYVPEWQLDSKVAELEDVQTRLGEMYHRDERRLDTIRKLREDLATVSKARNYEATDARIKDDVVTALREEVGLLSEELIQAYQDVQSCNVRLHDQRVLQEKLARIAAHVMDNPFIPMKDRDVILDILDARTKDVQEEA